MNPFLDNILSCFDKSALVVYVEDTYNAELNGFIESNYTQIFDAYAAKEIDFCYLPHLLPDKNCLKIKSSESSELDQKITSESTTEIYSKVKQLLVQPFLGSGLVWIDSDNGDKKSAIGFQLMDDKALIDQFNLIAAVVEGLCNDGK